MITETHVRLLRRLIICHYVGDQQGTIAYTNHLHSMGLSPKSYTYIRHPEVARIKHLEPNERWLCEAYGVIVVPEILDMLFLNSMWANPHTLYIRLPAAIPELLEYGIERWTPYPDTWKDIASANHQLYLQQGEEPSRLKKFIWGVRERLHR